MMRFDKHTRGVGFMFGLRHVLAKPWFINNVKYVQEWPRGQSNKSSMGSRVMCSYAESWGVMERRDRRCSMESDKTS